MVDVLPFENRNDLPEDAHFVDGVHDYVLTQLAKVEALNVVARTSVTKFRRSEETTQQIETALGATVLVEGAVQRSGSRVRVTVLLVDGGSALHLWAEHYDLDLSTTNALEVQSELGVAVSERQIPKEMRAWEEKSSPPRTVTITLGWFHKIGQSIQKVLRLIRMGEGPLSV